VWGFRKPTLRYWIFLAMFLGAEIGLDWPQTADHLRFLSDIFLRLVKVIIAPLILGSLTSGIAGHGDLKSLRRIGIKTIIYFEVVTTIALVIGLAAINLTKAGEGLATPHAAAAAAQQAAAPLRWDDFLIHVFPENLAKSVAEDQLLQVAVFAVIFGIALARVQEADRAPVLNFCKSLTKTMFRFTNVVMYLAPAAAGAAVAYTVAHMGMNAVLPLTKLMLAAYGAFAIFLLCVLLPIALWARLPIKRLVRAIAEPAGIAFATTTSEAALPRAMEEMEAFGVPREIVAFVIPAGYSFNMDGTALYLTIAAVFTAQAGGIHMSWGTQMAMMLTLMLTSKGMAGVPRAMLVILMGTAATFHLPMEPIFVLLGIDAIVDMGRASMNVIGNCLASAVVARSEGALNSSPRVSTAS
jgi:proton glutamate symport protein